MPPAQSHIHLAKANDRLVSHCKCNTALMTFPPQMDCPWCGCGWLFTCIECRKAFTFAKGVIVNESWEETAKRDLRDKSGKESGGEPSAQDVESWVCAMQELLAGVVEGKEYVCLDGMIILATSSEVRFDGWHSHHNLSYVPQAAALSDPSMLRSILGNEEYWKSTAYPAEA